LCHKQQEGPLDYLLQKFKAKGGMPFYVYIKLFDSRVWPVIAYGAGFCGTRQFSFIDAMQNRAMRFYMGTGKYIPNLAVAGDMVLEQSNKMCSKLVL
jgi:hypothetical protein